MTTIGFIGSGMIGGTVARLSVAAGHRVVLSNSRGPEILKDLVEELGSLRDRRHRRGGRRGGRSRGGRDPGQGLRHPARCRAAGQHSFGPRRQATTTPNATGDRGSGRRRAHQQRPAAAGPTAIESRRSSTISTTKHLALVAPPAWCRRPLRPAHRGRRRWSQGGGGRVPRLDRLRRGGRGPARRKLARTLAAPASGGLCMARSRTRPGHPPTPPRSAPPWLRRLPVAAPRANRRLRLAVYENSARPGQRGFYRPARRGARRRAGRLIPHREPDQGLSRHRFRRAVDQLNLDVRAGEIFGLLRAERRGQDHHRSACSHHPGGAGRPAGRSSPGSTWLPTRRWPQAAGAGSSRSRTPWIVS